MSFVCEKRGLSIKNNFLKNVEYLFFSCVKLLLLPEDINKERVYLDYLMDICSLAARIEESIKEKIEYDKLEKSIGYSYHHIRDFFSQNAGISLSRYILARKIANTAFEIRHSNKSITEIAFEYHYSNPDTFTKAFRRNTGLTPSQFKKFQYLCGRKIVCPGVYAPVILDYNNPAFTLQHI